MNTGQIRCVALAMTLATTLAACGKPDLAERPGRETDRAVEKAADKLIEQTAKTGEVVRDAADTAKAKAAWLAESSATVMDIKCGYGVRGTAPRWLCRFASK